jgi:hypothetical protein
MGHDAVVFKIPAGVPLWKYSSLVATTLSVLLVWGKLEFWNVVHLYVGANNTTSGRSRIDNQFRQMPFSAFTDNYLSGCSFQPEQGVSSPLREQVFGNQPSNCRYNLQPPMSSFPFFTTVGTHGFMHRYSSIWPFTYAPYPNTEMPTYCGH